VIPIAVVSSSTLNSDNNHITFPRICPVALFSLYQQQVHDKQKCDRRLWRRRRNKTFINSPLGKNQFAAVPSKIAAYLQLSDASQFTGLFLRRTSSTILANAGISLINLKKFGRWKSDSVAQRYVDDSANQKETTAKALQNSITNTNTNTDMNNTTNTNTNHGNVYFIVNRNVYYNCTIHGGTERENSGSTNTNTTVK